MFIYLPVYVGPGKPRKLTDVSQEYQLQAHTPTYLVSSMRPIVSGSANIDFTGSAQFALEKQIN